MYRFETSRPSRGGLILLAALTALAGPPTDARAAAQAPILVPDPVPLAWAIGLAERRSPALEQSDAARDEAAARIAPAGAWDDPRFSYEASNMPVSNLGFDATPLSGHQLVLRQKVPFPGLRGSRRDAARAELGAATSEVVQTRLAVYSAVERAWSELGFAQRALDVTERNLALLRRLIDTAEARYRVGGGLQQDVLRAQLELTTRLDEELRREAAVASANARLASLLDLPPETTFGRTTALEDDAPIPEIDAIVSDLDARSPSLIALSERVAAAERRIRAAELSGYPDVDLGVGYRIRKALAGDAVAGDDFLSAGITIRLPVNRSRWRAEAAGARAEHRRLRAAHRAARLDLEARARQAHAALVGADARARLIRGGLLPQAEQSLASARSAYEVGQIDILALIDSHVRLLDAELQHVRALADRRIAYAALETANGEVIR